MPETCSSEAAIIALKTKIDNLEKTIQEVEEVMGPEGDEEIWSLSSELNSLVEELEFLEEQAR